MRVCPHCRGKYADDQSTCPDDGMPLLSVSTRMKALSGSSDVAPGTMIGEFMVEDVIGRGGMGVIYRAIHPVIYKRVAIKVLGKRFSMDPKAVARFILEARAVNEIGHYSIVDIFSVGELADGRSYMVMELVDGLDLSQLLSKADRFEPGELLPVFDQVCAALEVVHAKGFIHRDIKPENIFVLRRPPRPQVKILDFGIAKLRRAVTPSQTEIGAVLGTPEYMSPEQCRGCDLDPTTDVYALGITLYQLVTGQKPFSDPVALRVMTMQIEQAPTPPSELAPISADLEAVILKALGKHPSDRHTSASAFFEELEAAIPEVLPWSTSMEAGGNESLSAKTLPPFPLEPTKKPGARVALGMLPVSVSATNSPAIAEPSPVDSDERHGDIDSLKTLPMDVAAIREGGLEEIASSEPNGSSEPKQALVEEDDDDRPTREFQQLRKVSGEIQQPARPAIKKRSYQDTEQVKREPRPSAAKGGRGWLALILAVGVGVGVGIVLLLKLL